MRWHRRERDPDPEPETTDLDAAEALVADLVDRSNRVWSYLRPRHERNHWQDAVEEMIYAKGTRP